MATRRIKPPVELGQAGQSLNAPPGPRRDEPGGAGRPQAASTQVVDGVSVVTSTVQDLGARVYSRALRGLRPARPQCKRTRTGPGLNISVYYMSRLDPFVSSIPLVTRLQDGRRDSPVLLVPRESLIKALKASLGP